MPLPNLLLAGVPKAGTTSLFAYLSAHPDICPSLVKEVNFFEPLWRPGRDTMSVQDYAAHFRHCDGARWVLEGSPSYSHGGQPVIDGIRAVLGSPRVVISLRDPAARFWSVYGFLRMRGKLDDVGSVREYYDLCRAQEEAGKLRTPLEVGRYVEWLPAWTDAFGDDLRLVFAERLAAEPAAVVADLFRWLDVDTEVAQRLDYERRNETKRARSRRVARLADAAKPLAKRLLRNVPRARRAVSRAYGAVNTAEAPGRRLSTDDRELLERYYEPSNAELAEHLTARGHVDLPAWLTGTSR